MTCLKKYLVIAINSFWLRLIPRPWEAKSDAKIVQNMTWITLLLPNCPKTFSLTCDVKRVSAYFADSIYRRSGRTTTTCATMKRSRRIFSLKHETVRTKINDTILRKRATFKLERVWKPYSDGFTGFKQQQQQVKGGARNNIVLPSSLITIWSIPPYNLVMNFKKIQRHIEKYLKIINT